MLTAVIICVVSLSLSSSWSAESAEESAAATAPIYVSFTRWENRTFSPRVYYYVLLNRRAYPNVSLSQLPPVSTSSLDNGNTLRASSTTRSSPTSSSDHPEEEYDINQLDFLSTRLNTPKPSQGKNRNKHTSIHFPSASSSSGGIGGTKPPPPAILQQLGTPPPGLPPDEHHFAFPTTALVLSNSTDKSNKRFGENEALEKGSSNGVGFYLKSDQGVTFASRKTSPSTSPIPNTSAPPSSPLSTEAIEIDSYGLTFDICRASKADWKTNNVLFSPLSFLNVMALLLLGSGSNGTTFNQLTRRLRPSDPSAIARNELAYHSSFQRLLKVLNTASGTNVALDIFNGVFVDSAYALRPEFRQQALELYSATTSDFDFGAGGEEFKNKVNRLVAYKTHDKIKSVIDGPVDPTTALALINTVYFRGSWEKPFMPMITRKRPFYVHANGSDVVQIDMMTNVLSVPFLETPNYRVIGLPYKGNKTGFFILLPTRPGIDGLQEMETSLTVQDFNNLFAMQPTQVALQMPKMRVEGSDTEVKELFTRMGLGSLFDPRTADLSRISDTSGLFIKSIVHKAILDVDESGTEAAAATVATGDRTFDDNPPVQFNVNRPFAFCILHIQAKTALFLGRVTRPTPLHSSGPIAPDTNPGRPRTPTSTPKRTY